MTDNELKKIAAKIAKCLALATSDNPQEAENAKRQADALMKKYNLTTGDVAAAQVHEQYSKTGGRHKPAFYLCQLAAVIGNAFGCNAIGQYGYGYTNSVVTFIGVGVKPELVTYTFDVLSRQLKKDRAAYQASLKRYKRSNKIRMADVFCETWVRMIARQVREFAGTEQEKQAIAAYKRQKWGDGLTTDQREAVNLRSDRHLAAACAGSTAARDVSIRKPVQSKRNAFLQ